MVGILSLCGVSAMGAAGVRVEGDHILLENGHVVYAVGTDGLNKAFVNKRTGRDHLDSADSVPFMAIEKDGQWHGATAVE